MDLASQVQERETGAEDEEGVVSIQPRSEDTPTIPLQALQIIHKEGDLFTTPEGEVVAHCVSANCAFGAGIAKQFRERYRVDKVRAQKKN